jgi:hypothetical protein
VCVCGENREREREEEEEERFYSPFGGNGAYWTQNSEREGVGRERERREKEESRPHRYSRVSVAPLCSAVLLVTTMKSIGGIRSGEASCPGGRCPC